MRDEKGHLVGDMAIDEPLVLWGSITGNVRAVDGSKFYLRGVIYGDLTVFRHGRVHVFGSISGNLVVMEKAKVILSGIVAKDVINHGGRLYIESAAKVLGKVKTEAGETKIERPARGETPAH
jgi:cytoskeletal protein CcmA (bactofilin family)